MLITNGLFWSKGANHAAKSSSAPLREKSPRRRGGPALALFFRGIIRALVSSLAYCAQPSAQTPTSPNTACTALQFTEKAPGSLYAGSQSPSRGDKAPSCSLFVLNMKTLEGNSCFALFTSCFDRTPTLCCARASRARDVIAWRHRWHTHTHTPIYLCACVYYFDLIFSTQHPVSMVTGDGNRGC